MLINADSAPENCAITALERKSTSYAKTELAHWRRRVFKQPNSPNWFAEISARGIRRKFSLETPNKENATSRARDIYQLARFSGWDAVLEKYRPKEAQAKTNLTVGDFIALAPSVANVQKVTLRGYTGALRKIVSDLEDLDPGKTKFDPYTGGHQQWIERVDNVRLAKLTPQKIQQWKRAFLNKASRILSRNARPRSVLTPSCARRAACSVQRFSSTLAPSVCPIYCPSRASSSNRARASSTTQPSK
jgi:hypothetical protein